MFKDSYNFSREFITNIRDLYYLDEIEVEFILSDCFSDVPTRRFDVIVSNPPYIPISERESMHVNVVNFEPSIALFVADNDPLIFYREIALTAKQMLSENGYLLFEIHQPLAQQTVDMLRELGYDAVELRNDCFDKPRMICSQLSRK